MTAYYSNCHLHAAKMKIGFHKLCMHDLIVLASDVIAA